MVQALMVMRRSRKQLLTLLIILISILIFYHYKDEKDLSGIFERRNNEGTFFVFHERVQVRLWIDSPPSSRDPWRHCLELYAGNVETLVCGAERGRGQLLTVEPLPGAGAGFQLRRAEECVTVDGDHNLGYQSQPCSPQLDGYWRWSNLTGISRKS